jgi:hypothetical protein
MYQLYRSGTNLVPDEYTDMVTMSQGERGILEFKYKYPGPYLFHAHKTEFAEKGWMGTFLVKEEQTEPDAIALSKGERATYPAEISNNEHDNNNNSSSTTQSEAENPRYIGTPSGGGS